MEGRDDADDDARKSHLILTLVELELLSSILIGVHDWMSVFRTDSV